MTSEQPVEVAIVGAGVIGLATAAEAARHGRVVVVDRHPTGHARGASHGGERIVRHAYPDPGYVALALAADEAWQDLERSAGVTLLHRTGCVEHGEGAPLDRLAAASSVHGVATELLTAAEAGRRWPALRFGTDVLSQPAAGWIHAPRALDALASRAVGRGATILPGTPVTAITLPAGGEGPVRVTTAGGPTLAATSVVVTAGAWAPTLVEPLGFTDLPPMLTTEEHVFFVRPGPAVPRAGATVDLPAFIHWSDVARYGLAAADGTVKIGEHHTGAEIVPDDRRAAPDRRRVERIERYARTWLPGVRPEVVDATTCLYTTTPSHDPVLDRRGPVVVATGFSGHGFKFAPELGRHLAALARGSEDPRPPFTTAAHAAGNPAAEPGVAPRR